MFVVAAVTSVGMVQVMPEARFWDLKTTHNFLAHTTFEVEKMQEAFHREEYKGIQQIARNQQRARGANAHD